MFGDSDEPAGIETPPGDETPADTPSEDPGKEPVDAGAKEDSVDKKADGDTDADGDKAPIEYEDFTMPEGVEPNSDLIGQFSTLASEGKLDQATAQKMVDLFAQTQADAMKAMVDVHDGWLQEAREHPEYGGKNFDANIAIAVQAIDALGGQDLKDALDETGAGNNPKVIKAFWDIGKMMNEDSISIGKGAQPPPRTRAETMYPDMKHE
jgi:hypothetical protein